MTTKRGRKSLYTPELHKQIVDTLATGVSIRDVCAYTGIDEDTYHRWCRNDKEFLQDTLRARTSGRIGAAAVIRQSALGNPQKGIPANTEDAKWYLERTDPSNWGRKDMLVSIGINPQLLKELKAKADSAGVDLSSVFEAMINEFAHVSSTADSEE